MRNEDFFFELWYDKHEQTVGERPRGFPDVPSLYFILLLAIPEIYNLQNMHKGEDKIVTAFRRWHLGLCKNHLAQTAYGKSTDGVKRVLCGVFLFK